MRCADDSLYCGWASDVESRVGVHNTGRGARYTRTRLPVELVWSRAVADRGEALREEARIKRLPRAAKLALVQDSGACPTSFA